ncbi:MAG: hypothetical protein K0Q66_1942 [Chitinophagaceae bacterium]|jgi:hypothetical protein|nr:hypothetical protein [Chitinophagaceae bacterium]
MRPAPCYLLIRRRRNMLARLENEHSAGQKSCYRPLVAKLAAIFTRNSGAKGKPLSNTSSGLEIWIEHQTAGVAAAICQ